MASDVSTGALRRWVRTLGYPVVGWALGRNRGPTQEVLDELPVAEHPGVYEDVHTRLDDALSDTAGD